MCGVLLLVPRSVVGQAASSHIFGKEKREVLVRTSLELEQYEVGDRMNPGPLIIGD